jgi:hypothetical protein
LKTTLRHPEPQLGTIAHGTVERLGRAAEPILPLRIAAGSGIAVLLALLVEMIVTAEFPSGGPDQATPGAARAA